MDAIISAAIANESSILHANLTAMAESTAELHANETYDAIASEIISVYKVGNFESGDISRGKANMCEIAICQFDSQY